MQGEPKQDEQPRVWGLVAAIGLHIVVCALALLTPSPSRLPVPLEDSVSVQVIDIPPTGNAAPSAAAPDRKEAPPKDRAVDPPEPPVLPHEEPPAMVKAGRMLSEAALADPRSRDAKRQLSALGPAERIEQLCGLEAMAQVGAWSAKLRPDRVVAYAMAAPKVDGTILSADGAALHSGRHWYQLKFKCHFTPDRLKVVAFEFVVGETIPRETWEEYSLPDESGALD